MADDRTAFQELTDPMLLEIAALLEREGPRPHTCVVIATGADAEGHVKARFNGDAHNLDEDEDAGVTMVETLREALVAVCRQANVPAAVLDMPEGGIGGQG